MSNERIECVLKIRGFITRRMDITSLSEKYSIKNYIHAKPFIPSFVNETKNNKTEIIKNEINEIHFDDLEKEWIKHNNYIFE